MYSYITGSRAYGYPREDSDIDLVICAPLQTINLLWDLCRKAKRKQQLEAGETPMSVRERLSFGDLNLVVFNIEDPKDMERYFKWKGVHDALVRRSPVTKEEAISAFREAGAELNYILTYASDWRPNNL